MVKKEFLDITRSVLAGKDTYIGKIIWVNYGYFSRLGVITSIGFSSFTYLWHDQLYDCLHRGVITSRNCWRVTFISENEKIDIPLIEKVII